MLSLRFKAVVRFALSPGWPVSVANEDDPPPLTTGVQVSVVRQSFNWPLVVLKKVGALLK